MTTSGGTVPYDFSTPVASDLTLKAEWSIVPTPPPPTPTPLPPTPVPTAAPTPTPTPLGPTPLPTPTPTPLGPTPLPTPTLTPLPVPTPTVTPTPTEDETEPSQTDTEPVKNEVVKIQFDTAGGDAVTDLELTAGDLPTAPEDPLREGYVFLGWYKDGYRFDWSTPLEADAKLTAKWEVDYPEDDLSILIGESGKLDGVLAKAIGISGTYDPELYRAELATPFPAIRLVNLNAEAYSVTFLSLPHGRLIDMVESSIGREEGRLYRIAMRNESRSHFESFAFVDQLMPLEGTDRPSYGKEAMQYLLRDIYNADLNVVDMIYRFKNSDSVISLRYPVGGEALSYDVLNDVMNTIQINEGERPVIDFIRYDRRFEAWQELTVEEVIETLIAVEDYFVETPEPRLNAELLSYVYKTVQHGVTSLTTWYDLDLEAMLELLNQEKERHAQEHPVVELIGHDPETNNVRLELWPLAARYETYMPAYYQPVIHLINTKGWDLDVAKTIENQEALVPHMLSLTEFATLVKERPEWSDPLFDLYLETFIQSFVEYISSACLWPDEGPNEAVIRGYDHYLEAVSDLERTLPEGRLQDRVGYYVNAIEKWKDEIDEAAGVFTSDDALAFIEKVNFRNMPSEEDYYDYEEPEEIVNDG